MWLIRAAMRRPITILIVIVGVALMSLLAVQRMKIDIFPSLGTPVIYVAQPYGGMDPAQMEGYIANYYEYHFLYVTGIEHVESRSIQGATLLKLFFHEGTDMSQALAETGEAAPETEPHALRSNKISSAMVATFSTSTWGTSRYRPTYYWRLSLQAE